MKMNQIVVLTELEMLPAYLLDGWQKQNLEKIKTGRRISLRHAEVCVRDEEHDVSIIFRMFLIAIWISSLIFVFSLQYFDQNSTITFTFGSATVIFLILAYLLNQKRKAVIDRANSDKEAIWNRLDELALSLGLRRLELFTLSKFEREKLCGEKLKVLATTISSNQAANLITDHAENQRQSFKKLHALFLEFDLVDEKWDGYFPPSPKSKELVRGVEMVEG